MLDVDGVLVNGRPADGRPWASELEADLGIPYQALVDQFFARHWNNVVTGQATLREVLDGALSAIAPDVPVDDLIAYWFAMDSRIDASVLSHVGEIRRRGAQVWLATNQEHQRAGYLMDDLGLSAHVDGMVYSANIGAKKPEAAFFAAAAERAGYPGDAIFLVDDTVANVAAARCAGWGGTRWTGRADLISLVERA